MDNQTDEGPARVKIVFLVSEHVELKMSNPPYVTFTSVENHKTIFNLSCKYGKHGKDNQ